MIPVATTRLVRVAVQQVDAYAALDQSVRSQVRAAQGIQPQPLADLARFAERPEQHRRGGLAEHAHRHGGIRERGAQQHVQVGVRVEFDRSGGVERHDRLAGAVHRHDVGQYVTRSGRQPPAGVDGEGRPRGRDDATSGHGWHLSHGTGQVD
jgi:hypothetical protein